jgi:hypothetical protein
VLTKRAVDIWLLNDRGIVLVIRFADINAVWRQIDLRDLAPVESPPLMGILLKEWHYDELISANYK